MRMRGGWLLLLPAAVAMRVAVLGGGLAGLGTAVPLLDGGADEVHVYDALGNFITQCPLFSESSTARVAGVAWYNQQEGLVDPDAPMIAIAFDTGRVQLMATELDEKPILIDTGLRPPDETKLHLML